MMTGAEAITVAHSDAELLQRARTADAEAFADLVNRHQDLVVNYLARLTNCRSRAEEVAQETFVRFYQQLHRYRDQGMLTAYLLRIATNLVRSEERRKRRWRLLHPVLRSSHTTTVERGPQSVALANEAQREVTRAIAALDLRYRAPLVLREIEGLSYRKIADALAINEGTVKSRLHRARELLKQRLAPYWTGGSRS